VLNLIGSNDDARAFCERHIDVREAHLVWQSLPWRQIEWFRSDGMARHQERVREALLPVVLDWIARECKCEVAAYWTGGVHTTSKCLAAAAILDGFFEDADGSGVIVYARVAPACPAWIQAHACPAWIQAQHAMGVAGSDRALIAATFHNETDIACRVIAKDSAFIERHFRLCSLALRSPDFEGPTCDDLSLLHTSLIAGMNHGREPEAAPGDQERASSSPAGAPE